jgi:hypothetical protein
MNDNDISASRAKYAQLHQGADAVARYERKLGNRIDVLRDEIEVQTLAPLLKGTLFDCTIGIGRLIGRMPGVTRYDGMDLSAEFVEHVAAEVSRLAFADRRPDGRHPGGNRLL